MRIVRVRRGNLVADGIVEAGSVQLTTRWQPADALTHFALPALSATEIRAAAHAIGEAIALDSVTLLPPLATTAKVICLGLNFRAHADEAGDAVAEKPALFTKFADTLAGHGEALLRPRVSDHFDFEGEIAVVIGRAGRHIATADALSHVFGYAKRYEAAIAEVRRAEAAVSTETALTDIAARALFKLMAYKDEYEVARLYTDVTFAQALARQFEGKPKLTFHLAPPLLSRRDKVTGERRKVRFGPWMMAGFKVLARLRGLRGTAFDPFGYMGERRMERALIAEYETLLRDLASSLSVENLGAAKIKAGLALEIRGYGHVKEQSVKRYRQALTGLPASAAIPTTRKQAG